MQGVGFRPFVYGLARELGLAGFVLNDGSGVVIEAEGPAADLDAFAVALRVRAPSLARVDGVVQSLLKPRGGDGFTIELSTATGRTALIPPDVATCDDCLAELHDPDDRRYRYPFINCTQCGPRFTIVTAVPYDRANTTMARFTLCETAESSTRIPPIAGSMRSRFAAMCAARSCRSPSPTRWPSCAPDTCSRSRASAGGIWRAMPPTRLRWRDCVRASTARTSRLRS